MGGLHEWMATVPEYENCDLRFLRLSMASWDSVQEVESLVAAHYHPEASEDGGVEAGAKKVVLPEDVLLLDKCADAAQRLLNETPYTSLEARFTLRTAGGFSVWHDRLLVPRHPVVAFKVAVACFA